MLPQALPQGHFSRFLRSPKNAKARLISGLSSYSGGRIRTCDLRVMSPNQGFCWATWGTVSSGFCEIKIRGDRLGSVGHVAPFVAPAPCQPAGTDRVVLRDVEPAGGEAGSSSPGR